MAITDVKAFAHLTQDDVNALESELNAIRGNVEASLGERDARYIRRVVVAQRLCEVAARAALFSSHRRGPWLAGTGLLAAAKVIEMMELGHNISHGQWDWMNDPEIHSSSWEWDLIAPSAQWKRAHNVSHHIYTNIVGMDRDLGFGIFRMTRDEPWRPVNLLQPAANIVIAVLFEWAVGWHHWSVDKELSETPRWTLLSEPNRQFAAKIARQTMKDYVFYPALTGKNWKTTVKANAAAGLLRSLWAYVVIFCGHFPDGAEKFSMDHIKDESHGEWYLRQLLGTANFNAGPIMAFMSGHLCYQIEHHLFPDLPSNRYPEMAKKVRALCEKYDLPYTSGPLFKQYLLAFRTIQKLALPDSWLQRGTDDAPETSSERRFTKYQQRFATARGRAGLATALGAQKRANTAFLRGGPAKAVTRTLSRVRRNASSVRTKRQDK